MRKHNKSQRIPLFPSDFFSSCNNTNINSYANCNNNINNYYYHRKFHTPLTIIRNVQTNHSTRPLHAYSDKFQFLPLPQAFPISNSNVSKRSTGVIDLQHEYDEDKEFLDMLDHDTLKDKHKHNDNSPNELFKRHLLIYHNHNHHHHNTNKQPSSNVFLPKVHTKPSLHPSLQFFLNKPERKRHPKRNLKNTILIGTPTNSANFNILFPPKHTSLTSFPIQIDTS